MPYVFVESLRGLGYRADTPNKRDELVVEDWAPVPIARLSQHRIWKHIILEFIPADNCMKNKTSIPIVTKR